MIRRSTTAAGPEFKKKNSKGRSFKHIDPSDSDGGGDGETASVSKRSVRGMKNGVGSKDRQNPKDQRARKIEAWCSGKSESYK